MSFNIPFTDRSLLLPLTSVLVRFYHTPQTLLTFSLISPLCEGEDLSYMVLSVKAEEQIYLRYGNRGFFEMGTL